MKPRPHPARTRKTQPDVPWTLGTALALALAAPLPAPAADWLGFRGPGGVSPEPGIALPTDPARAVAWRIDLDGRGLSSPVVVGERVFVTCATGPAQERLHVRCLDARDGRMLWERQYWATGRTMTQSKTCVAAPTPVSDGRRLYALFSSNDLFCLDLDGALVWLRGLTRDYANASNSLGLASSPVLAGGVLVVQVDNDSDSFAAGIDPETGVNRWRIARPKAANWSTPTAFPGPGPAGSVVFQAETGLQAVDAGTGRELWTYAEKAATIASGSTAGGVLYIPCNGVTALKPPGAEGAAPSKLWEATGLRPGMNSPLVWRERIYSASGAGTLKCAEAASGTLIWQLKLKGPFSASAVAAGDQICLVNEKGLLHVVEARADAREGRLVRTLDLGDGERIFLATPAISGRALYLRNDVHLWKLGGR